MISIYSSLQAKEPNENTTIEKYLNAIKEGHWQDQVLAVRTGKMEKSNVQCVTLSGVFSGDKTAKSLVEHSGFICLDIDAKDQVVSIDREQIKNDPYTYAMHDSVSGNGGFVVIIKIDPAKHLDAFMGIEKYYRDNYNIIIDQSCKNINRLRFVSFDPYLYHNPKAKTFKNYLKKIEKITTKTIVVKSDFEDMVSQAAAMNLFDDYGDYIRCAFALAHEFGESGRDYFHALCCASQKYDYQRADKDYSTAVARGQTGVTIGTIYYIFKQAGIETTSTRTEEIKRIVKYADDPKEALKEAGIEDEENLIERLTEQRERTKIDEVIDLIKIEKIKFNEITRNYEFNGEEMNDRILAEFYTKVWMKIDEDISKDKIFTLIQNRKNVESYNPIHRWFEMHKNLTTNNEFEKLKKCFKLKQNISDHGTIREVDKDKYLDIYLKKWLMSLIGSAFGTYSLMILVLNGEQGTNKTKFFRNLLPEDLRQFYSESNLDEGKDSEILMTKKWLIIDDEFGGKSKKDATKLKRLSSQQTFSIRMPYGRVSEDLQRLAVLAGTSNEAEVINDPTGNRRVIPLNIDHFNFELYEKIDKDKLFIEMYREWKKDPEWWYLTKKEVELLNASTIENQEIMIEEELILKHFNPSNHNYMTTSEITSQIMHYFSGVRTNTKRVGMALKKLGYKQEIVFFGGKTVRSYRCQFSNPQ